MTKAQVSPYHKFSYFDHFNTLVSFAIVHTLRYALRRDLQASPGCQRGPRHVTGSKPLPQNLCSGLRHSFHFADEETELAEVRSRVQGHQLMNDEASI